jgi:hypothetical protein
VVYITLALPPPPVLCHVISGLSPSANGNMTGSRTGSKHQHHALGLAGMEYTTRTLTLVPTCIQYAYSCKLYQVVYSIRVNPNGRTSSLCIRGILFYKGCSFIYRYQKLRYTFTSLRIILYSVYSSQTFPPAFIISLNNMHVCHLSHVRCAIVEKSVFCQEYFPIPQNRRCSLCGEKLHGQDLRTISLQLSEIISVPNRFVKMSEFPSPGEESSHGKNCRYLCLYLPTSFTLPISTCSLQNISKKHRYMLYKSYESLSTSHLFCLYYPIHISAATLLVAPCLYLDHNFCILNANNCTFSRCNGSNIYRE